MDIKSVLKKYGENTYTIAEKMKIKQPSVMQYINGNPTVKKLEDIARAIGCSPAEFFADWQPSDAPAPAAADELPFDNQTKTEKPATQAMQQAIVCPHCGGAMVITVTPCQQE